MMFPAIPSSIQIAAGFVVKPSVVSAPFTTMPIVPPTSLAEVLWANTPTLLSPAVLTDPSKVMLILLPAEKVAAELVEPK